MPRTILTVTLNPAIDKTVHIRNFRTGSDVREESVALSAGGKGLNVSRALKSLGRPSLATGLLGGYSGAFIHKALEKERIPNDFLFIQNETRTNLTVIDPAANKVTRVLERGPSMVRKESKNFQKKYLSLLSRKTFVVFSGSIPRDMPSGIYVKLIALAKQKNVKTILDTSGTPLALGLKAGPFLVKPNLEEAEGVLGYPIKSVAGIKNAVEYFHKKGVKIVIISLGKRGAVASDGKEIWRAQVRRIKCKNNVGCGDALLAGFLAAFDEQKILRECLAFGVACGAANALNAQPGFIQRKDVSKLLKTIKTNKVL